MRCSTKGNTHVGDAGEYADDYNNTASKKSNLLCGSRLLTSEFAMSVTGPAVAAFHNTDKLSFNPTKHDDSKKHKATEWHGKQNIQVHERPVPVLTDDVRTL